METSVIGIDVAKEKLDVYLFQDSGQAYRQFDNDPAGFHQLVGWLKHRPVQACLEATGQYSDGVAEYLYEQGYPVSLVNPARIKAYGRSKLQRNKTDKADAKLIAYFCAEQKPALWTPPPAAFKELQALVRHLDDLQVNLGQENNRRKSGLRSKTVIAGLELHIRFLKDQIKQVKWAIQDHIEAHPELKKQQDLLITITDFVNARQLAAYAGLTPKNFFSGSSVHQKAILTKTGNANLRKILYMPAIAAKRWNPDRQGLLCPLARFWPL